MRCYGVAVPRVRIPRPVTVILAGFSAALATGTGLLMLPFATVDDGSIGVLPALFTATSALSVTGLVVLDTGGDFTLFGQLVILGLIQVGGLGIMVFTMLLGMLVARRAGLRFRRAVAHETRSSGFGGIRPVIVRIIGLTLVVEAVTAAILVPRFRFGYDMDWAQAILFGVFHAISAFNNAGFGLHADSVVRYATDPLVILPLALAVIIGGMGFPVLVELVRRYRFPLSWSLTTRIVVVLTPLLLLAGTVFIAVQEWRNPSTLGAHGTGGRILAAFFQSTIARTAGFNSIDIAQMHPVSWFGLDILMFIGGGPAGTAGGVKVTTVAVLAAMTVSEVTGGRAVNLLGRRIDTAVHRQASTVIVLALALVLGATMLIMLDEPQWGLDRILFEAISAFATVGLSTGITAELPAFSQIVLIVLMAVGRIGPVTLASALALRRRHASYALPEERPLIG